MIYPLLSLRCYVLSLLPFLFHLQHIVAVVGHVSTENELGDDVFGLAGVGSLFEKINLRVLLKNVPEGRNMHILKNRHIFVLLGQGRLALDFEVVVGPLCVKYQVLWLRSWAKPATRT